MKRLWESCWCTKCGEHYFSNNAHTCEPSWLVWQPDCCDTIEDARTVYAESARAAAVRFGEVDDQDSADYSIANGCEAQVCVRAKHDEHAPVEWFEVEGHSEPVYEAHAVKLGPVAPRKVVEHADLDATIGGDVARLRVVVTEVGKGWSPC